MGQKKLVWMITPKTPEEFFVKLKAIKGQGEDAFLDLLVEAKEKDWIEIFGITDRDPKDILAQLQEFYDVKYIKGE